MMLHRRRATQMTAALMLLCLSNRRRGGLVGLVGSEPGLVSGGEVVVVVLA